MHRALANREKLARRLGVPLDRMVGCQQVHGTEVALVGAEDGGRGMYADLPSMQGADAMVTDTPGVFLLALSADCPPVFFYDPHKRAIGLAHSGWKGTAGRIAGNVVAAMQRNFGSDAADIVAAIGPGIGPCCYNIYPQVVETVEAAFPNAWDSAAPVLEDRDGVTYFNLWEGIRRALLDAGVRDKNISVEGVCTAHNVGTFYSHRGEAGQCGLFGAVLGLREGF
jgi:YfiH family protein